MKYKSRQRGKIIVLSIYGIICLILAFLLGLQKNFYFAALSFLSFFMIAVMLFHRVFLLFKSMKWDSEEEIVREKKQRH